VKTKFAFGNKIPFAAVTEFQGKREPTILYGIPADMDPEVKGQTKIRLIPGTRTLEVVPTAGPERRGRKHIL
jgi:hypothetical protein